MSMNYLSYGFFFFNFETIDSCELHANLNSPLQPYYSFSPNAITAEMNSQIIVYEIAHKICHRKFGVYRHRYKEPSKFVMWIQICREQRGFNEALWLKKTHIVVITVQFCCVFNERWISNPSFHFIQLEIDSSSACSCKD